MIEALRNCHLPLSEVPWTTGRSRSSKEKELKDLSESIRIHPNQSSPEQHIRIHTTMYNTTFILDDASPPTDVPVVLTMTEMTESTFIGGVGVKEEEEEESPEVFEKLIQDLAHYDNAKVNAALDALSLDLDKDEEKCNTIAAWGGCAALVRLLKDRLKKATKVPQCDQVTELNELAELETIEKTLCVFVWLSFQTETGRVVIATVGGVQAVGKVMQAFPMCKVVQERGCDTLRNLTWCSIGKKKAIESGGIEVVLAAINNHLDSAKLCEHACSALSNIVSDYENRGLLITLNCGAAVEKVGKKWPDADDVQTQVRKLAKLFVTAWTPWIGQRY
jgi:hypothetical protein